jgi:hypothetical protein
MVGAGAAMAGPVARAAISTQGFHMQVLLLEAVMLCRRWLEASFVVLFS